MGLDQAEETAYLPILGITVKLKWFSLVLLIVQNTVLVLCMRYSRVYPSSDGILYLTSTAVVMSELLKLMIASTVIWFEIGNWDHFVAHLRDVIVSTDTLKVGVPGLLYVVQNNLLFVALSNLDAAVYQLTYQLKILTTALFSVTMLGKQLTGIQVVSLLVLALGVALVQISKADSGANSSTDEETQQNRTLGLVCVLLACCSSGFAGVYFEKILKHGRKVSLFVRNVQLSLFGISLGMFGVLINDSHRVLESGFFQGYTSLVWTVIIIQAGSGFVIATVMKYADNILKGFATSLSIILSTVISSYLFTFRINALFFIGAVLVIASTFMYGYNPRPNVTTAKVSNP